VTVLEGAARELREKLVRERRRDRLHAVSKPKPAPRGGFLL
jgi:hypothetical protein